MEYNKEEYIKKQIQLKYKRKAQKKIILENLQNKNIKEYQNGNNFDIIYLCIKKRIYNSFKKYNLKFDMTYDELIGCSKNDLEVYLISLFKDNMTINNHGEWEIDHIIPISKFDFTLRENIFKCFNYKNLQPLSKTNNRLKYNKIN